MAIVRITPSAWMKIQALVVGYDKEVAWYATVDKLGKAEYRMTDILVYPQLATSAFVEDTIIGGDASEMVEWLETLTDEQYNKRRGQGHSHVNMSVSPSQTDKNLWKEFALSVQTATINPYVVTMIINKKCEMMWWVCDWEDQLEWRNDAIDVILEVEDNISNVDFFEMSKALVKDRPVYKPSAFYMFGGNEKAQSTVGSLIFNEDKRTPYQYGSYGNKSENKSGAVGAKKEKEKEKEKADIVDMQSYLDGGYDDFYGDTEYLSPPLGDAENYTITINDSFSSVVGVAQISSRYWDVVCEDVMGNIFGINCNTKKPPETNKMADPNSVAMTIYDAFADDQTLDYFIITQMGKEDEEIMSMHSVGDVRKLMEAQTEDYEILDVATKTGAVQRVLSILVNLEEKKETEEKEVECK